MSEQTPDRAARGAADPEDQSAPGLELDSGRDSGSWRGALPETLAQGTNAKTLDPEADNLDPEVFRHIQTAALSALDPEPATTVRVESGSQEAATEGIFTPMTSGGWTTPELDISPKQSRRPSFDAPVVARTSSASISSRISTTAGVRATSASASAARSSRLSGDQPKAPYERARDRQKLNAVLIVLGVVVAAGVVYAIWAGYL